MIGIITLFQGLVAVVVNQTETILYRPSLLGDAKGRNMTVSYWMSCTISSRYGSRIAWNIIQNDGSVYCWSVPCKNSECLHVMGLDEHVSNIFITIFPTTDYPLNLKSSRKLNFCHLCFNMGSSVLGQSAWTREALRSRRDLLSWIVYILDERRFNKRT